MATTRGRRRRRGGCDGPRVGLGARDAPAATSPCSSSSRSAIRTGRATARRASSASRTPRRSGWRSRRKHCRCGGSSRRSRGPSCSRSPACSTRAATARRYGRRSTPALRSTRCWTQAKPDGASASSSKARSCSSSTAASSGPTGRSPPSPVGFRSRTACEFSRFGRRRTACRSRPRRDDRGRPRRRRRRRLGDAVAGGRRDRAGDERLAGDGRVLRPPRSHTLPSVIDWNEETGRHAYSLSAGENVLKVGLHHSGVPVEPGERGEPDPEVVQAASEWVRQRYPAADPSPRGAETCLYTNITNDEFVIERHGSIIGCSACSGHGFKFAPAVGARVAALA